MTENNIVKKRGSSVFDMFRRESSSRQECITSKCLWNVGNEVLKSKFLNQTQRREQSLLLTSKIVSEKQLGNGKSDPWKLTLKANDLRGTEITALFKPYRSKELQGRRTAEESIASECGGFLVSQVLGVHSATGVVRTLTLGSEKKSVVGFLQVWVGGEPLESFTPEAIEGKVLGEHESDFDAIALLDFLLGNGDRGQPTREHPGDEGVQINLGNYLIAHGGSPHESIVAIDYGDAFNYGSSIDPSKREAYYRLYTLPARVIERLQALKNPQNRKSLVAIVTELLGDSVATVFEERLDFILSVLHGNTVSLDREKNNQSK